MRWSIYNNYFKLALSSPSSSRCFEDCHDMSEVPPVIICFLWILLSIFWIDSINKQTSASTTTHENIKESRKSDVKSVVRLSPLSECCLFYSESKIFARDVELLALHHLCLQIAEKDHEASITEVFDLVNKPAWLSSRFSADFPVGSLVSCLSRDDPVLCSVKAVLELPWEGDRQLLLQPLDEKELLPPLPRFLMPFLPHLEVAPRSALLCSELDVNGKDLSGNCWKITFQEPLKV